MEGMCEKYLLMFEYKTLHQDIKTIDKNIPPNIGDNKYIIDQKSNELNFMDFEKTIIPPIVKKIAPVESNIEGIPIPNSSFILYFFNILNLWYLYNIC